MDTLIEELKNKHKDNLLLIGLRGSNALGIKSDDIDLLVVLEENDNDIRQDDIQIISWNSFLKLYSEGSLEIVETINNIIYINEKISDHIGLLLNDSVLFDNFNRIVKVECFLAIKNQLKIARKFPEHYDKCVSKAYLFYKIINSDYIASDIWCQDNDNGRELVEEYVNNRRQGFNDNELFEFLWDYRSDKNVRKTMMQVKNESHVVLKEKIKSLHLDNINI